MKMQSEKVGLKLNIQKTNGIWSHHFMANRWGKSGNSVRLIFLGSKLTAVGCHFLLQCMKVESESEVTQSCLTLSDPMDCSLPGSSIHGIFQARVLEWGTIAFSNDQPRQHIKKQRCYFADKGQPMK